MTPINFVLGLLAAFLVTALLASLLNYRNRKPRFSDYVSPHVYDGIRPVSAERVKRALAAYERSKLNNRTE